MALATRAPAGAAAPPGLALLKALRDKNKSATARIGGHIKDVCVQFRTGGADIPAIITSIPEKDGGGWSQSFTALILNVHGLLGDNAPFATTDSFRWHARNVAQQAFFDPSAPTMEDIPKKLDTPEAEAKAYEVEAAVTKRRAEMEVRAEQEYGRVEQSRCIVIPVSPPGEKAQKQPNEDQLAAMPETTLMYSFTTYWLSAKLELLKNSKPGDVVTLKSVYCNGAPPLEGRQDNDWGKFLNVGALEPARGLTLSEVYKYTNTLDQTYFLPIDPDCFDPMRESETRYGVSPVVVHMRKDLDMSRQRRHFSITRTIWPEPGTDVLEDWSYTPKGKADKKPCANLKVRVMQWVGEYQEDCEEGVMVGASLYDDQVAQFGITDMAKWFAIAPHLFRALKFTILGVIDHKLTQEKYAGAGVDDDISFPIHIKANLFVADTRGAYTKIGIPVTAAFVRAQFTMAAGPEITARDEFAVAMAPTVVSLESESNAGLRGPFTAYADKHPGRIDFRAIIGCEMTATVKKRIATMSPETGSALLTGKIKNDKHAGGNAEAAELMDSMNRFTHIVIVAMNNVNFGDKVNSERKAKLAKFLGAGQPVPLAIADASASADADEAAEEAAPAAADEDAAGTDDVLFGESSITEIDDEAEPEPEPAAAVPEVAGDADADAPRAKGKGKRTSSTAGAKPKKAKGKGKHKRPRLDEA